MDRDEPADRVAAAYGSNYGRLRRIKRKYDPLNLLRMNQNILPG
ncbi:MAG TPA: BBE domain-containing protein [Candidatus Cryosericum sp.]|nr:BBE domain-containing protein [Candidatus Cryosericum sp.]